MRQVIRMTEEDLANMITESVTKILNEKSEAWEEFKGHLNLKGLGKYAIDRIHHGKSEAEIGETNKLKAYEKWKETHPEGTIEQYEAEMKNKNSSSNSDSSSDNSGTTPSGAMTPQQN